MTLYAATHAGATFKCAAAGAPVVDWTLYDSIYTERYMKTPKENAEGYKTSSPLLAAKDLGTKLVIFHGTSDDNVHMQNTMKFVDELMKARKDFVFVPLPRQAHGPRGEALLYRNQRLVEWFEQNLCRRFSPKRRAGRTPSRPSRRCSTSPRGRASSRRPPCARRRSAAGTCGKKVDPRDVEAARRVLLHQARRVEPSARRSGPSASRGRSPRSGRSTWRPPRGGAPRGSPCLPSRRGPARRCGRARTSRRRSRDGPPSRTGPRTRRSRTSRRLRLHGFPFGPFRAGARGAAAP